MKKVKPGDAFSFPAPFYNRLVDLVVNDSVSSGSAPSNNAISTLVVQAKNNTTEDLPAFSIVVLDDAPVAIPADITPERLGVLITTPTVNATKPAGTLEELNRVGVLPQAIQQNAVGAVVALGLFPLKVLQVTGHRFVRTIADTTTHLKSCDGGGIELFAKAAVNASATWGIAKLGCVVNPFFKRCRFELDGDLTTSDASAQATILSQEGPGIANDDTDIVALNYLTKTSGVYRWEGATDDCGLAEWSTSQSYKIIDLEC